MNANARATRGSMNYHAGFAAEEIVAGQYAQRGLRVVGRRWRGRSGEIDLIAREGDALVFIEVKKGSCFDTAAASLRPRQISRLFSAASEYIGGEPRGQDTEMRFDVALVDARGAVQVIENALMAA